MLKRSTITDVAKLAGVSKVTVSYVLNGQAAAARISIKTRERVRAAAVELDYHPNAIARSMVTKRADTLGVVFQYAQYFASRSDFTKEVMLGINQAAVTLGYDLMLHTKPYQNAKLEARALTDGRVDGILILRDEDDEALHLVLKSGFPCVLIFSRSDDPAVAFVDADNYHGGGLAAEHLLSLGHRRLGMLCGSPASTNASERRKGFCDAIRAAGATIDDLYQITLTQGREAIMIEEFLSSRIRPSAIFSFSDEFALMTCRIAAKLGIAVPGDLSIVGFDSLEACEHCDPPLTSVRQPVLEMARMATHMLARIAGGEPVGQLQQIFPTELDVRGSTSAPKSG